MFERMILIIGLLLITPSALKYSTLWPFSVRSDSLRYKAPCWGENNKIYFIKTVIYGRYYLKPIVGPYDVIDVKYYLCSMNYDGTDKKEIVEIFGQKARRMYKRMYKKELEIGLSGYGESCMDYCEVTHKLVYSLEGTGIWTINPDGSDERCISEYGSDASWSPDGKQLVHSGGFIMNADGSNNHGLFPEGSEFWGKCHSFLWSPKGDWIAFVCRSEIWIIRPDGSERRKVCRGSRFYGWTPDGEKIVGEGDKLLEGRYICNSYLIGLDGKTIEEVKGVGSYSLDGKFRIHRLGFGVWNSETGMRIDPFANSNGKGTKIKEHFVYKRPDNIW